MKIVLAALLAACSLPALAGDAGPRIKPLGVDATVEGTSFADLTAQWWRWAFDLPVEPWLERDGDHCDQGQSGPVWFLAGTDGRFEPRRECSMPEGKHVLLPVINMIYYGANEMADCAQLKQSVRQNNDRLSSAVVLIDGVPVPDVERFRVATASCFRWDEGKPISGTNMAASDGFWLLLPPLPAGRHTITVGANYGPSDAPYAGMRQNFEYVLHVGARSRVLGL